MPVIINDFEVMLDPPREESNGAQTASQMEQLAPEPRTLRPVDIDRIVRYVEERRRRILAD